MVKSKSTLIKLSQISKQTTGNGRTFKNPDVPRKDYSPKELQDKLPTKKEK